MKRVVITGVGAITPLGNNIQDFWNGIKSGKSGVDFITHFDTNDFPTKIGAEVKNFNPEDYINKKDVKRMDRFCHFAVVSSGEAIKNANIDISKISDRVGVSIGCGIGGFSTIEKQHEVMIERGNSRVSPFMIPMIIPDMASGYVAITYGAKGPNICTVTACASGANSIGEAFRIVQRGDADIMITGGTEAAITPFSYSGFCSAKAMSRNNENPQKASRPFDKNRDGFVMGEGAGILILEELEHALKRNANILAEIVGYGMTCDAYHITSPDPEALGVKNSMNLAINDAKINVNDIDYINAHGTSTEANDKTETLAIKKLFVDKNDLLVSSTKSMTGHLLGASGGIEAIISVLAIKDSVVPSTINYENPDPECDLNYVPNYAINKELRYVLSNSLGFGGHNVSLVFKKFEG
ncbi:MAG: beta-ketoacyl-ACP synthase II [Candidatus Sericytochromatia bacterium]